MHALTLTREKKLKFGPRIPNPNTEVWLSTALTLGLLIIDSDLCLTQHSMSKEPEMSLDRRGSLQCCEEG